jgi:hypothetical protein
MEEFLTYEYSVEAKGDPSLKRKKILLIIGYVLYCAGLLILVMTVGKLFLPLFAIVSSTRLCNSLSLIEISAPPF